MLQNSAFFFLPWVLVLLQLIAYVVGITLGILGIQALRKYLRE
ncbi:hypothetical protein [Spirosoma liriopis]|nr:hypothetical protein [Spirosoma liriopis]